MLLDILNRPLGATCVVINEVEMEWGWGGLSPLNIVEKARKSIQRKNHAMPRERLGATSARLPPSWVEV